MRFSRFEICFFLLICVFGAYAQGNDNHGSQNKKNNKLDSVKVGFVNIRVLLTQSPQIGQIQQHLSKKFEEETKAIVKLRRSLSQLNIKYDTTTNKETLVSLQADIADKQLLLAKLQKDLSDSYSLKRNEALGKLQTLIVQTVAEISKENKLDIVLNNTGIIYVNNRIDITPMVFKRLTTLKLY